MVTFGLLSAETRFACSRSRGAAGAGAGSSLSSRTASDRRIPHRLGSGHEWPLGP